MDDVEKKIKTIKYASGVNLLAGIWLLFAAFVFGGIAASAWNDVLVGLVVTTFATWHILKPEVYWASLTNVLLGAWLVIAPSLLHYAVVTHLWNDVIVGLIIVVFGAWAVLIRPAPKPLHMPHGG